VPSQNKHIPKGKGKSGTHPGKGQDWSSPDKKLPPKTQGPKGSEKNE